MCGRFALTTSARALAQLFALADVPEMPARYNIAPSQKIAAIRANQADSREMCLLKWGLVPPWAKDTKIGVRLINARAETADDKPAFREAFKHKRCLIPADAFYEWQQRGGNKYPYAVGMHDDKCFMMAGLWQIWQNRREEPLETCTILTTVANNLLKTIHSRMPVIVPAEYYDLWLDRHIAEKSQLSKILVPYDVNLMKVWPVSPLVNNPANDCHQCLQPIRTTGNTR